MADKRTHKKRRYSKAQEDFPRKKEGEFKSIDTQPFLPLNSVGAATLLNQCVRGDDIGDRTGREIIMKSIELSCFTIPVAASPGSSGRFIVVYDRQSNGVAPTWAMVVGAPSTTNFKNLDNRKRFKILFDKTIIMSDVGQSESHNFFTWYRRLRHPVTYNAGNAGTIADINTGALYLLTYGSTGIAANPHNCWINARVRFLDS